MHLEGALNRMHIALHYCMVRTDGRCFSGRRRLVFLAFGQGHLHHIQRMGWDWSLHAWAAVKVFVVCLVFYGGGDGGGGGGILLAFCIAFFLRERGKGDGVRRTSHHHADTLFFLCCLLFRVL